MEQEIKEKLLTWLYNCSSYEKFKEKNYYELDRRLIEKTIEELVVKLLQGNNEIWNIEKQDIMILKVFLYVSDPERTMTTSGIALKLNISQPLAYNSLCKTKNQILQEINKRRIMNMSKEEILDLSIEDFNLSNRAVSSLLKNNIFTIEELTQKTTKNLKALEYMGPKTAQEIIDKTHSFGIAFLGEKLKTTEETLREKLESKIQKRYNIEQEICFLKEKKTEVEMEIEILQKRIEGETEKKLAKRI